jgi:hypothetical protein
MELQAHSESLEILGKCEICVSHNVVDKDSNPRLNYLDPEHLGRKLS